MWVGCVWNFRGVVFFVGGILLERSRSGLLLWCEDVETCDIEIEPLSQ